MGMHHLKIFQPSVRETNECLESMELEKGPNMKLIKKVSLILTAYGLPLLGQGAVAQQIVKLTVNKSLISMGQTITMTASISNSRNRPLSGIPLSPYWNGRQWGALEKTNASGKAIFLIPLPSPGEARLQVAIPTVQKPLPAYWIWYHTTRDMQTVYFTKRFRLVSIPSSARLHITCDDSYHAYLNGRLVAQGTDFHKVWNSVIPARDLVKGQNTIAVESLNGSGPAGLLASIVLTENKKRVVISTNSSWMVSPEKPVGWPMPGGVPGVASTIIGTVGGGVWGRSITGWPGLSQTDQFPVGRPMPKGLKVSNTVLVRVMKRRFMVRTDPRHLVGIEYEPWFTPLNATWDTAEAIPIEGRYDSFQEAVIRQHCLWFDKMGINYLLIDWSNNLWGKERWADRAPGVNQLIRSTTLLLNTYAKMRREGIPTPQVTLLLGLDNGPTTTITALNEEMNWVYANLVQNPKYKGLWLNYEGKPLIVLFNGGGPGFLTGKPPIDQSKFTVRWMTSQLQYNPDVAKDGYWSWMDGSIHPIPTYHDGKPEAITITPAFFGDGGWTYPQAMGRRNGATYLEEFQYAMTIRPKFLLICQWNEFAGQAIGAGYGPKHDQFVDCYNVPLSNDIEPTSLSACAYRGCGGWGFRYYNLTRAMISLYETPSIGQSILVISNTNHLTIPKDENFVVRWSVMGKKPTGYNIILDHRTLARDIQNMEYTVPQKDLTRGSHTLTVQGEGTKAYYLLAEWNESARLRKPVLAQDTLAFIVE
jgi:hypothetical protein